MDPTIQFIQTTPDILQENLKACIKSQLVEFFKSHPQQQTDDLLTREEAAEFLKVTLQSLHNWTRKGKVKAYGMGARVYYRKNELLESLTPLNK